MEVKFTAYVLGRKATERLERRQVTQTVRSHSYPPGTYTVFLDDNRIGEVTVAGGQQRTLDTLTEEDAKRGGFDTVEELLKALKRAGWRFRPLSGYQAWVIRFEWIE